MTLLTKPQLKRLERIRKELDEMLEDVKQKPVPTYGGGPQGRVDSQAAAERKQCLEQDLRDALSKTAGILNWLNL